MSTPFLSPTLGGPRLARRLAGHYARSTLWFAGAMYLLWLIGFESIWAHPTPFYALWFPAFATTLVPLAAGFIALGAACLAGVVPGLPRERRALLGAAFAIGAPLLIALTSRLAHIAPLREFAPHYAALFIGFGGVALFAAVLRRLDWCKREPASREVRHLLLALCVFFFLFACVVACVRGGLHGISQAYDRQAYEYIGDIGKAMSIRDLFARYLELHPYLSLHAKANPPGPIAILWVLSWFVGREPLALSFATVAVAALAVFPLYGWARDLAGVRTGVLAAALYALAPGPLLFAATCADILFTPIAIGTLYLFGRAILRPSAPYALAAGAAFALMSLMKFSLIGVGFYFAAVGLWQALGCGSWRAVIQTAALMIAGLLALQILVWLWSGFNYLGAFHAAKTQFDLDQHHLDLFTPRYDSWLYRILNPFAWFWFAGLPAALLWLRATWRPPREHRAWIWCICATLLALNLLYLGRGEAERSALYMYPFFMLPAALLLQRWTEETRHFAPLAVTAGCLVLQTWLTEALFYTYW